MTISEQFDDVIAGWRLFATLSTRTPLDWLRRSGEFHSGSKQPKEELPAAHAMWMPVTKSWTDLGIELPQIALGTAASEVGQVANEGSEFLAFLLRFREIGELMDDPDEQEREFRDLARNYPVWTRSLGGSLARLWFSRLLRTTFSISLDAAERLYDAGLCTPALVGEATDAAILALPRIGKSTLRKLRE